MAVEPCSGLPTQGALLSPCGTWRYRLWRAWGEGPRVLWVMLNPSTADEQKDDPTILRCLHFARAWGYSRIALAHDERMYGQKRHTSSHLQ